MMNPVMLYFGGPGHKGTCLRQVESGVKNKLCSYFYPEQLSSWLEIAKDVPGNILIDSGAFSAWNKRVSIDFDKYIEYCKTFIPLVEKQGKIVRVVNLDVIPGKKGTSGDLNRSVKREDKEIIENAAKRGYENLLYFKKKGITPIHVFHQGESFRWLDKMIQETDYIGVSPANDLSMSQKGLWI